MSVHLSVHTWGGGTPARFTPGGGVAVPPAGGTPQQALPEGTPHRVPPLCDLARGTHLRYPPLDLAAGGYPTSGNPPIGPGQGGYPLLGGTPHQVPPCQTWLGGVPLLGGTPPQVTPPPSDLAGGYPLLGGTPPKVTAGVLDTLRLVCLLRSRRKTFFK